MNTMQDAISGQLEKLQAVAAGTGTTRQIVNGEVSSVTTEQSVVTIPAPVEIDEDGLADVIRERIDKLKQLVATRDARDSGQQQRRNQFEKNEMNLRDLYRQQPEFEKYLREETRKLAEAKREHFLIRDISVLETGVQELTEGLVNTLRDIAYFEENYPELKAKLDEERIMVAAYRRFLERFAREVNEDGVRYTAHGTPNPCMAEMIKVADAFLEMSIKEASASHSPLIVLVDDGMAPMFVSHDGKRWAPKHPQLLEGVEVCKELTAYAGAIYVAKQKKLQQWADGDVEAGLLLTPESVAQQKKDPRNRHNIVNMVRCGGDGFCFVPVIVPVKFRKSTTLSSYSAVSSEMKVEYGDNSEGVKQHMLRVTAITIPQYVEDIFFPEEGNGNSVKPTFYFDDLHEISTWRRINPIVRDSLANAVRWAESMGKRIAIMEELSDVSRVSDLRTIHQLADGAVGTAVIHAPKPKYGYDIFDIGFKMISDGITVRPGSVATDQSRKLAIYEAILDGKPVAEFFARAENGSFLNEELEDLVVRNEMFELKWVVPLAVKQYDAEEVSHANAMAMVMPLLEGGREGTYVLRISVKRGEKEEGRREVAYVVRRTDDKLTFVAGLTHYSVAKLVGQGFCLNKPYSLGELKGYILHVFQKALDIPYDTLPEHLKGARAKR